jgi:NAD(P)-dependent dehydrogenase (short-subunit alcohol dehydrogenase family)
MPYPPTPVNSGVDFTATTHSDSYPFIKPVSKSRKHGGKAVFVTGATKGIGRATVLSFVQSGASRIAVAARDFEAIQKVCVEAVSVAESAGLPAPDMLPLKLDVCDSGSVAAAASAVKTRWGSLDILVNNAGYLASFVPLLEGDERDWWRTWEVNVKGIYAVTKTLLPLMLDSESGDKTIVNLSSMLAMALYPGSSAYQASKLAVMSLTEALIVDYFDRASWEPNSLVMAY